MSLDSDDNAEAADDGPPVRGLAAARPSYPQPPSENSAQDLLGAHPQQQGLACARDSNPARRQAAALRQNYPDLTPLGSAPPHAPSRQHRRLHFKEQRPGGVPAGTWGITPSDPRDSGLRTTIAPRNLWSCPTSMTWSMRLQPPEMASCPGAVGSGGKVAHGSEYAIAVVESHLLQRVYRDDIG